MKRIFSILLAMVMLMSVMTLPTTVNAEATTPYVYYPQGVSQQKIYLKSTGTFKSDITKKVSLIVVGGGGKGGHDLREETPCARKGAARGAV